ncbi:ABC transporter permease [Nocardioides mangrovicus]|uniref:Xylose transport system permease protein XylH n=1 Tax=Nocardioides mangrovicus TaxID=2478913 RepID=A0A3L8NY44_9ACTN|nr:ABC transporter permease [Nocardioides mangrovicus]RLV47751.1 ABC transporter permease [Nocardioides mangrovicus]
MRRLLTLREGSIVVVTILAIAYFAVANDRFLTSANFKTLLPYFAPFAILAVGEVMLMVAGEIDLSIGSVYLFAPFMFYEFHQLGLPLVVDLLLCLVCAALIGALNGVLTAVVGISSFIVTLGTLLGVGGLTLIISGAAPVAMPGAEVHTTTESVKKVVNGHTITLQEQVNHVGGFARVFGAGIYSELIWALLAVALLHVVLRSTRWGMYTVAVGGNRHGAAEAGIKVRSIVIRNFVLCALLAGFVGVLEAMRASSVTPDTAGASETMFRAVSAAVIGGTLLAGGEGTVVGALLGALFLGVLRDGLVLDGVSADYLDFILGFAILIAMAVNIYVGRVRKGSGHA